MSRTNIVISASLSCLAGIYVARYYDASFLPFLVGLFILASTRNGSFRVMIAVILISFWAGNLRGSSHNQGFEKLRNVFETKQTLTVTSLEDAEYDSKGQLAFNANQILLDDEKLPGQVAVSGFGEFNVLRGDTVEITGKLFEARGSNQARMSYAQMDTVRKNTEWYNVFRRKFIKKLRDNLPEPLSSFAAGLLIGQRSTIPDTVIDDLRVSGLAHIIAVSGYNLTIIIRAVLRLFSKFSRYQKLLIALSVVGMFLLITGFSASIVRAGIVTILSLLAWYYGRNYRPAVLLTLSAAGTALYKPEYVWGDVGWYLSFLAFTGIMIVGPIIRQRFFAGKDLKLIRATFIDTLAVLTMIVPYSLYIFGTLSFVALPANMIVAPVIPLAMALSAFTALLPYQLAILAIPTKIVLDGILAATHLLAELPYSAVTVKISQVDMFILYFCVATVTYLMWRKSKMRLESSLLLQ